MADSDDLTKQLGLMARMNAVLQQIATGQTQVQKALDAQTISAQKTLAIMEKLRNLNVQDKFRETTVAAQETAAALNGISDARTKELAEAAEQGADSFADMANKLAKTTQKVSILGVAVKGLSKGFQLWSNVGGAVLGLFGKIAEAGLSIGAAILAIPFKIFGSLLNIAASANTGMMEFRQAIEDVRKQFGTLTTNEGVAVINSFKTMREATGTGLSAWRVFGNLAERLKYMNEMATSMGATFSVLRDEFGENGHAIAEYNKGLGLSAEAFKGLSSMSIAAGKPLARTLLDITKQSTALGKAFGTNQKVIARDMGNAAKNVKAFGQMTIQQLGVAATYANKLGVELENIAGVMDAFDTFESAAENSAKLSQSFGVTIDAMKMLTNQNPAENIDELRQAFKGANVDANKFDRAQLTMIQQMTGLDAATAKQVFSANNYGVSLDDIKKKSETAGKSTMTQQEAMSKLADSIDRMVKAGPALKGSFFEMFLEGFARGIMSTKEFRTMLINMRVALRETFMVGIKFGRAFVEVFPGVRDVFLSIAKIFERGTIKEMGNFMLPAFRALIEGKKTFGEFFNDAKTMFDVFFGTRSGPLSGALEGFKNFWVRIAQLVGDALPWVGEQVANLLTTVTDYLTGKKKIGNIDASGVQSFWEKLTTPLMAGANAAWEKLSGPLANFLDVGLQKITELLTSDKAIAVYKGLGASLIAAMTGGMALSLGNVLVWQVVKIAITTAMTAMWAAAAPAIALAASGPMLTMGTALGGSVLAGIALGITGVALAGLVGYFVGEFLNYLGASSFVTRVAEWMTGQSDEIAASRGKMDVPEGATGGLAHGFYEKEGKLYGGDGDKETEARLRKMIADRGKKKAVAEAALNNPVDPNNTISISPLKIVIPDAKQDLRKTLADVDLANSGDRMKNIAAQIKKAKTYLTEIKASAPELEAAVAGGGIQRAFNVMTGVASAAKTMDATMAGMGDLEHVVRVVWTLDKLRGMVKEGAIKPAFDAIKQIVKLTQDLDDQLAHTPNIDIATKLAKFAVGSGLGSKAQYTVQSKDVVINLNLSVTLEVDEVEKVMIMRKESIIRDRINFATNTPDSSGKTEIPETYTKSIPRVNA